MTKLGAVFWVGLVIASGFTTFRVKYAVQDIEDQLMRVRKHTVAEQQEIRVLTAEWTYLNQPDRLADLNRRFLQLSPITTKQLQVRIEDLPLRPLPAPAAPGPDILVAATPAPAAPAFAAASTAAAPAAVVAQVAAAAESAVAPTDPPAPAVVQPARSPAAIAAAALLGISAQAAPARPVKAAPASLDALIAQIAEAR